MGNEGKRISVRFYITESGTEPVREWLRDLSREDKVAIGTDIAVAEFGWPIGMPTCRHMGGGLWEVRSSLRGGRIARVIFCMHGSEMVLLHGFIKKSQKTPLNDLRLAEERKGKLDG